MELANHVKVLNGERGGDKPLYFNFPFDFLIFLSISHIYPKMVTTWRFNFMYVC